MAAVPEIMCAARDDKSDQARERDIFDEVNEYLRSDMRPSTLPAYLDLNQLKAQTSFPLEQETTIPETSSSSASTGQLEQEDDDNVSCCSFATDSDYGSPTYHKASPFSSSSSPLYRSMMQATVMSGMPMQFVAVCAPVVAPPSPAVSQRTPLRSAAAPYVAAKDRQDSRIKAVANKKIDRKAKYDTAADVEGAAGIWTSLMFRNLPDGLTRTDLFKFLGAQGFGLQVDFLYVPVELNSFKHYGYAFVNTTTPEAAQLLKEKLHGFGGPWGIGSLESEEALEVNWSEANQGLNSYIERYRNSRIMHSSVEDEHKPALYLHGRRISFPRPSKIIRAPRARTSQ